MRNATERAGRTVSHKVFEEVEFNSYIYPEGFKEVLEGKAYWWEEPIEILNYEGIYYYITEHWWRKYDPKHPRCYYCGKFIKAGDWWKGKYTLPCLNCGESLYFL